MAIFAYESRVDAPLSTVWEFHATTDGLEALTPSWMGLSVDVIRGPHGDHPEILVVGSIVELSVRPFGVGPRQRFVSEIVERHATPEVRLDTPRQSSAGDGPSRASSNAEVPRASFVDVQRAGPFDSWRHAHLFTAVDGGTRCIDHIEYTLPYGSLGEAAQPAFVLVFERLFRARHARLGELLERPSTPTERTPS